MGALSALTIGDVIRALRRYQPVALAVGVLLIVFALLPEPAYVEGALDDRGSSLLEQTKASRTGAATTPTTSAPAAPPGYAAPAPGVGGDTFASPFPSSFSPPSDGGGTFGGSSGDSDTSALFTPPASGDREPAPLRIAASAWASRTAGTPVEREGVPEGTLPVGVRVTDDKRSYVRLAGDGSLLRLAEDPAGARDTNGPAVVQACAVTDEGWQEGEAMPFDGAPAWDAGDCALGTRGEDGVWTFDLSGFAAADDPRGFALVPGEGAGVDFQVAFKKTAV